MYLFVSYTKIDTKRGFVAQHTPSRGRKLWSSKMNANNGGSAQEAPPAPWAVGLWNKKSISVMWLLWVFALCVAICMDIIVPYQLLKYNPEDIFYGCVVMVAANCYFAGALSNLARDIMEASESVHDVPWWCYGCTSSTRPKKRPVALWKWVAAKMNRNNGGNESAVELAEEAARGQRPVGLWKWVAAKMNRNNGGGKFAEEAIRDQRAVGLWNKNSICLMWILSVCMLCLLIYLDIIVLYYFARYNSEHLFYGFLVLVAVNCFYGGVVCNQALDVMEASETVHDVPWWCYGCTSSTRPKKRPVKLHNKNSITVMWLWLVSEFCLVICISFGVSYYILKYYPEDIYYFLVALVAANGYFADHVRNQTEKMNKAAETIDDLPWWCYGLTRSSRPRKRLTRPRRQQ